MNSKGFFKALSAAAVLFAGFASVSQAQYFPTFGAATTDSVPGQSGTVQGLSIANVPLASVSTSIMGAFNVGGHVAVSTSYDGLNYTLSQPSIYVQPYCDAVAHAGHCALAITNFNSHPYISFRDASSNLQIWRGDLSGSSDTYLWTQVFASPITGGMSTSPSMVVFQGKMFVIYGYGQNFLEETYTSDGVNFTQTRAGLGAMGYAAPTQVGLSVLNNTLYMTAQQNNSNRELVYWSTTDGFNWTNGFNSSLGVDSGVSMVTYNNNLVFATKQNNNQNHLFLFSSPDGVNWFTQQQGGTVLAAETTPSLALFNGGITITFQQPNFQPLSAFASH